MNEWIKVENGLPEHGSEVLTYLYKYQGFRSVQLIQKVDYENEENGLLEGTTHWMRLPKAPNE